MSIRSIALHYIKSNISKISISSTCFRGNLFLFSKLFPEQKCKKNHQHFYIFKIILFFMEQATRHNRKTSCHLPHQTAACRDFLDLPPLGASSFVAKKGREGRRMAFPLGNGWFAQTCPKRCVGSFSAGFRLYRSYPRRSKATTGLTIRILRILVIGWGAKYAWITFLSTGCFAPPKRVQAACEKIGIISDLGDSEPLLSSGVSAAGTGAI